MKKIICAVSMLVVSVFAIVALCSFTSRGKHCNYTVGCNCPSFAPITNGDVWEESYCKHCKHHKKYHK